MPVQYHLPSLQFHAKHTLLVTQSGCQFFITHAILIYLLMCFIKLPQKLLRKNIFSKNRVRCYEILGKRKQLIKKKSSSFS